MTQIAHLAQLAELFIQAGQNAMLSVLRISKLTKVALIVTTAYRDLWSCTHGTDLLTNIIAHQELGHSGLLYGLKSPAEKSGRDYKLQAFSSQVNFAAHGMVLW